MSDADGTEHARFESLDVAANPSKSDVTAYSIYDASEQEYTVRAGGEKLIYGSREELEEDWMVVRAPFIPETEFDRMPTPEDFLFVVFPDADTEAFDEPMVYERGDVRPLLPSDSSWSTSEARPEESVPADGEPQPSSDDSTEQNSNEAEDDESSMGDTNHSGSIADAVSRLTGRD